MRWVSGALDLKLGWLYVIGIGLHRVGSGKKGGGRLDIVRFFFTYT